MKPIIKFTTYFFIVVFTFSSCKKEKNVSPSVPPAVNPGPGSVPIINTQLVSLGKLSVWRVGTAAATAGNKILFAGGFAKDWYGDITDIFSRVDIYDIQSQTWSTAELSQARYGIAVSSADNKIVFAGGETTAGPTTRIDIYDVVANSWTTAELSEARGNIAAASSGNNILFAGGGDADPWSYSGIISNRVDIYDASLNTWTTATLSEARTAIVASAAGSKIIFAGGTNGNGPSNRVDIYDTTTHAWSTASLSQAKRISAATSVGNTIFFVRAIGGGDLSLSSFSRQIDVYDVSSGRWSVDSLPISDFLDPNSPSDFAGAVTSGNFAFFFPRFINNFIIYNANTRAWSISSEVPFLGWWAAFVTANSQIYLADWDGVWRVQF